VRIGSRLAGLAQNPVITPGGTVNAASNAAGQPVAPGGLVAIYGNSFATAIALASSVQLSTSLGSTSVTINGMAAPLDFVAPGQINAQVPFNVLPAGVNGSVNVVVTTNGVPSPPDPVVINQASPGIFGVVEPSGNYAIAYFGATTDPRFTSYAWPPNTVAGLTTFLAKPGDILTVYATGLGAVNPPEQTGSAPAYDSQPQTKTTVATTTVFVGNVPATVLFSGLTPSFPGVYQVNIEVPQVPPGNAVPIQIQVGGVTSPANVNIGIGAP